MRTQQLAATILVLSLTMSATSVALAKPKGEGRPQKNNASMNLDNFNGTGSMDAFKSAQPELRAGWQALNQKKFDQAIGHFNAAIALYPSLPKCYIGIGRALEGKGASLADAETAYKKSIELDSGNWHAWKRLANVLYEQKKFGPARQALASGLSLTVPPKERDAMDRMVQAIDSAEHNPAASDGN